jgi:large subunit ribosomal protein L30
MTKVRITLTKGISKRSPVQRATLQALGLRRTNSTVDKELNPAIEGMIAKVKHVLRVENI